MSGPLPQEDDGTHEADGIGKADGIGEADGTPAPRHDWRWRRAIRARRPLLVVYRGLIITVGFAVVVLGLILVPLPGPGWLIVFIGLAILASEFEPAHALLQFGRRILHRWNTWVMAQPWWVRTGAALTTAVVIVGAVWLTLRVTGIPSFVPDPAATWLSDVAHVPVPRS